MKVIIEKTIFYSNADCAVYALHDTIRRINIPGSSHPELSEALLSAGCATAYLRL
jgi:hypothetical protein